jgi:hypothetical protein
MERFLALGNDAGMNVERHLHLRVCLKMVLVSPNAAPNDRALEPMINIGWILGTSRTARTDRWPGLVCWTLVATLALPPWHALRPAADVRRRQFGKSRSGRFTSLSGRWSLQSQHQAIETLKNRDGFTFLHHFLVGGFKHFLFSHNIYGIILPIDFHNFQDG